MIQILHFLSCETIVISSSCYYDDEKPIPIRAPHSRYLTDPAIRSQSRTERYLYTRRVMRNASFGKRLRNFKALSK